MRRYHWFLLGVFLAVWIWSAINPKFPEDWLLENYLMFVFVPLIVLSGWYLRLSNVSYTLITVFMLLHVVGSHYTYSEVPFGYTLQEWFGANRNMYDRLVHWSFGLLLAYPIREAFMRVARARGVWALYLPFDVTLAFSAAYEIIEWLAAALVSPETGLAFLGTQGDVWDAQKDMLAAGSGAALAMVMVALANWVYNAAFLRELKSSLKIPRDDEPLGEVVLRQWWRRR
jgi:putative membrane protein